METVPGRFGEIIIVGEKAMMMRLRVQPNVPTPPHSHPHEQMGIVLEGEGTLYIDGEEKHIKKGTSFWVPPNASHNFDATGSRRDEQHEGRREDDANARHRHVQQPACPLSSGSGSLLPPRPGLERGSERGGSYVGRGHLGAPEGARGMRGSAPPPRGDGRCCTSLG